jgi:hypothetical protein
LTLLSEGTVVNYITPTDRPNIIRPGEIVHFGEYGWGTIVDVRPILPGVVSPNYKGSRPVARIAGVTDDGQEVHGTDCDICGWLVPETGAMTTHDARICLP